MQGFSGSTCFLSSPEAKGTGRGIWLCRQHGTQLKLGCNSRANFWVWNFPLSHCFSPEKFSQHTTATSNLGQAHVPKVHQASSWDVSAGFPGKNVVNDGWIKCEMARWSLSSIDIQGSLSVASLVVSVPIPSRVKENSFPWPPVASPPPPWADALLYLLTGCLTVLPQL